LRAGVRLGVTIVPAIVIVIEQTEQARIRYNPYARVRACTARHGRSSVHVRPPSVDRIRAVPAFLIAFDRTTNDTCPEGLTWITAANSR
jgi:hypothetical protein